MEELAKSIGVSRPTLSKYFQEPESVRLSTRQLIKAGLSRVEYIPNFFATRMNRKSTKLIGVIVPLINDLFLASLIEKIEKYALQEGFTVIIQNTHGSPELEILATKNLMSMNVDGVILAPIGNSSDQETIKWMKNSLPVVFVDSYFRGEFENVDYIGTNNRQSIALIIDYLVRTGSEPIFLGMPPLNSSATDRERAYTDRMSKLEVKPHVIPAIEATPCWEFEEYAFQVMDAYFSRGAYTQSTILCANDRLAIGVLRAAHRHHLFSRGIEKMGNRFRVAGHDDHPLSKFVYPTLTTVKQNTAAIGRSAVSRLLHHIRNPESAAKEGGLVKCFDAELIVRESA